MTEDQWIEQLQPIPNPYTPGMGFDYGDGSCLMSQVDLQTYRAEHTPDDDQIWSIVECDETEDLYISPGQCFVNVLGYMVTKNTPEFAVTDDILVE